MKLISLILLMLFCTIVPEAQANRSLESFDRFKLFTACAPMDLIVGDLPEDAKKIRLTKEMIKNSVESRLRSGRIFNDKNLIYLYVNVNVFRHVFSIDLDFKKPLKDPSFPELYGSATTWSRGSTGTHGGRADSILSSLSELLDIFLVDYFRVNEKACK